MKWRPGSVFGLLSQSQAELGRGQGPQLHCMSTTSCTSLRVVYDAAVRICRRRCSHHWWTSRTSLAQRVCDTDRLHGSSVSTAADAEVPEDVLYDPARGMLEPALPVVGDYVDFIAALAFAIVVTRNSGGVLTTRYSDVPYALEVLPQIFIVAQAFPRTSVFVARAI